MSVFDKAVSMFSEVKESGSEIYETTLEKKAISLTEEELTKKGVAKEDLEEGGYEEIVAEKMEELRETHKGMLKGAAFVLGVDWLI